MNITADAVVELIEDLRDECQCGSTEPVIARARLLAIANEVCGLEYSDPLDWVYGYHDLLWEWETRGRQPELLQEIELAAERFDDEWQRLCDEPADDREPEPEEDSMGGRTKAIETTAGKWRCGSCGCENPVDANACGTCEVERGAKPPAKAKKSDSQRGVGLVNGQATWQCTRCRRFNPIDHNWCSTCSAAKPAIPETQAEAAAKEAAAEESTPTTDAKPSKRRGAAKPDPEFIPTHAGRTDWDVPLNMIHRRTDNPRQAFDLAKLEQLAESIRSVGLISRIVVRATTAEGWELWAGERRVRACELLGWKQIPARVFPAETPDATMEAIRAWENLQREDLDPIEEARSLQQLLSSGAYASQKALGEAVGLSQGEVSLRIRLTELPAEWQQAIIAHEISTSHAKHLYAWLDLPQVLKKATQKAAEWEKSRGRRPSERDFQHIVQDAARSVSKSIAKGSEFSSRDACPFSVSKELRAQLDVRPVPNNWGGTPSPRAFNVTLWNQKAKEAKQRAAEKAKADPPAQQHRAKSPTAERSGPEHWKVCDRIGEWALAQILARLKPTDKKLLQRIALMDGVLGLGGSEWLAKRLKVKAKNRYASDAALWPALAAADDETLAALPFEAVQAACTDRINRLDWPMALAIARTLGADPASHWQPSDADLDLYPDKALPALAKSHGYDVGQAKGKKAIVAALVKAWRPGDLPKAYAEAFEKGDH